MKSPGLGCVSHGSDRSIEVLGTDIGNCVDWYRGSRGIRRCWDDVKCPSFSEEAGRNPSSAFPVWLGPCDALRGTGDGSRLVHKLTRDGKQTGQTARALNFPPHTDLDSSFVCLNSQARFSCLLLFFFLLGFTTLEYLFIPYLSSNGIDFILRLIDCSRAALLKASGLSSWRAASCPSWLLRRICLCTP